MTDYVLFIFYDDHKFGYKKLTCGHDIYVVVKTISVIMQEILTFKLIQNQSSMLTEF